MCPYYKLDSNLSGEKLKEYRKVSDRIDTRIEHIYTKIRNGNLTGLYNVFQTK